MCFQILYKYFFEKVNNPNVYYEWENTRPLLNEWKLENYNRSY